MISFRQQSTKNLLESDDGKSIGWRRGDRSKQSAPTSRRFEDASNVTNVSDLHVKKQDLHATSTDAGS
jgi:hypothetical protein